MLEACLAKRVPRLIFTSTIDVVIGEEEIREGDETLPIPDKFLFPGYPATKLRAEQLVLKANGASFSSGEFRLRRACLYRGAILRIYRFSVLWYWIRGFVNKKTKLGRFDTHPHPIQKQATNLKLEAHIANAEADYCKISTEEILYLSNFFYNPNGHTHPHPIFLLLECYYLQRP